jgi:DNA-directed RNA polymerase subunit beta
VSLLIKALGEDYQTDEQVIKTFYNTEKIKLNNEEVFGTLKGRCLAKPVVSSDGEVKVEVGERINIDTIDVLREEKIKDIELIVFPNSKEDDYLINTLHKDKDELYDDDERTADLPDFQKARKAIHHLMRPGEPYTPENASMEFDRMFFNPKTYSLGAVGRYMINKKFGFSDEAMSDTLTNEDIIQTIKYILYLISEVEIIPLTISTTSERRVRCVGELLMNQIKVGFQRMERVIKERMTIQDQDVVTPQMLISIKRFRLW